MPEYDILKRMPISKSSNFLASYLLQGSSPDVEEINKFLSSVFRFKYSYFFNYGRLAIQYLFRSMRFKKIVFPSFICPKIIQAAIQGGVTPILIDVNKDNFNLDAEILKRVRFPKVDAIFAVHTFGVPFDTREVKSFAEAESVYLIEDVAHALFAEHEGQLAGSFGDFALLSLYKQIPNINGSVLLSNLEHDFGELASEGLSIHSLIKLINISDGQHQRIASFLRKQGKPTPTLNDEPIIANQPGLSLVIFRGLLKGLWDDTRKLTKVASYYASRADESPYLRAQRCGHNSSPSWFAFSVSLLPEFSGLRDRLHFELRKKSIFCDRLWFNAPAVLPEFKKYVVSSPNAAFLAKSVINLPIRPHYTREDVDYLFDEIEMTLRHLTKEP